MLFIKSRLYEKNNFNYLSKLNSDFLKITKECENADLEYNLSFEIYYYALENNIGMIRYILFLCKRYTLPTKLVTDCIIEGACNGNNVRLISSFWKGGDEKSYLTGALEFSAVNSVDFFLEKIPGCLRICWTIADKKSVMMSNFVKSRT